MKSELHIGPDDEVSDVVANSEEHNVRFRVDDTNRDVYLEFSSREALYEFGKSLMGQALYGPQQRDLYSLVHRGKLLVVDGARLTTDSSRVFVFCK
jgi:hypothetical protein